MREVLFKNLTSQNAHKRDLILSETVTQGNMVINTQRRSIYFIKDNIPIKNISNLDNLKELNEKDKPQKRHCYVVRRSNFKTGEDRLFCKIRGYLYLVTEDCVYLVVFVNAIRITIRKLTFSH